jgi:hypothetical protein
MMKMKRLRRRRRKRKRRRGRRRRRECFSYTNETVIGQEYHCYYKRNVSLKLILDNL